MVALAAARLLGVHGGQRTFWHRKARHQRYAHARRHHVFDGLQRRTFKALVNTLALRCHAGKFRAHLQHMVTKTMPCAQQQHMFVAQFSAADRRLQAQRMLARYCRHKRLVVQRHAGQPGVGKRLSQNRAVNLSGAQHFQQTHGEIFLQHQGHLRRVLNHAVHQLWQQIGAYGVDHAQGQSPVQRVLAALGQLLDGLRLLQHHLRLAHNLFAQRRHGHITGAALKQLQFQLFFQLFHRHRQRRLRHMAGLGRAAKVAFAGHGNDVFEFGEGHGGVATPDDIQSSLFWPPLNQEASNPLAKTIACADVWPWSRSRPRYFAKVLASSVRICVMDSHTICAKSLTSSLTATLSSPLSR